MMTERVFNNHRPRRLFAACLIASVGIHCLALLAIYKQPLLLTSPLKFFFHSGFSRPVPFVSTHLSEEEKNSFLAEALNCVMVTPFNDQNLQELDHSFLEELSIHPTEEKFSYEHLVQSTDFPESVDPLTSFNYEQSGLSVPTEIHSGKIVEDKSVIETPNNISEEGMELTNFVEKIKIKTTSPDQIDDTVGSMVFMNHAEATLEPTSDIEFTPLIRTPFENITPSMKVSAIKEELLAESQKELGRPVIHASTETFTFNILPKKSVAEKLVPNFEHYSLPDAPLGRSWDKYFNVDLHAFTDREHSRYVFFLTFEPAKALLEEKLRQNFYFLIDRSNSREKHRFAVYKKSVLRALSALQEGDKFNIVVFDQKASKFKEKNASFSKTTLIEAEAFLNAQEVGKAFSASDLYSNLHQIMPNPGSNDEIHTAILLSDGNTILKPQKQKKAIANWLANSTGKVSLYTVAVGNGNNTTMLRLLSSLNKGKMLYSDTFAAFPRRLSKLVSDLRAPLAKDIKIASLTTSPDKDVQIHFFPSFAKRPTVYMASPYVIAGTIDELKDFTILLQAKHGDEYVNIEKTISFSKAKQATDAQMQIWSDIHAQKCFELFVEKGDDSYLDKAKKFLSK